MKSFPSRSLLLLATKTLWRRASPRESRIILPNLRKHSLIRCSSTAIASNGSKSHERETCSRSPFQNVSRSISLSSLQTDAATTTTSLKYQVFVAVGSNQGDSFANIAKGLDLLCDPQFHSESYLPTIWNRSSFLYHTKPMYVEDQASFWNAVVKIRTDCDPHTLLLRLKLVEERMGRDFQAIRNGPRPLDLDILLYYEDSTPIVVDTPDLEVPHPRLQDREFVLAPLIDLASKNLVHPSKEDTMGDLLDALSMDEPSAIRLLPLPRKRFLLFDKTLIMGILNVTPDSFSDGGKWTSDRAVDRAMEMVQEGATIVDIGGESTRPGAKEIEVEEQIKRTVPVIKAIRERSQEIVISIDTRHAAVAKAAVEAGADIVNDVSGGLHDPSMLCTVAELKVPIVLMHMKGTPESMQELTDYSQEGGVVRGVVQGLLERSLAAEDAGIPKWMQILDPGIGFAKDMDGNLSLLKHYSKLRREIGDFPLLLGTSRKGFIGRLTGETLAENRDFGTVGSCITALCLGRDGTDRSLGCNILRVHNVKGAKQATDVLDGILQAE